MFCRCLALDSGPQNWRQWPLGVGRLAAAAPRTRLPWFLPPVTGWSPRSSQNLPATACSPPSLVWQVSSTVPPDPQDPPASPRPS